MNIHKLRSKIPTFKTRYSFLHKCYNLNFTTPHDGSVKIFNFEAAKNHEKTIDSPIAIAVKMLVANCNAIFHVITFI